MGATNKLLAPLAGKPMVCHVAEAASASRARPVVIVTGHMAAEVAAALAGLEVTVVTNPDYSTGLAGSLKSGIRALPPKCDGALIMLGDMPGIAAEHLDRLIAAFTPGSIVVPARDGKRGNPVLWPATLFGELLQLEGDAGARRLIDRHAKQVREVDPGTDAIFADIDTPEELEQARLEPQGKR
jgi:molybdenum cofactor cytidylyltransferase